MGAVHDANEAESIELQHMLQHYSMASMSKQSSVKDALDSVRRVGFGVWLVPDGNRCEMVQQMLTGPVLTGFSPRTCQLALEPLLLNSNNQDDVTCRLVQTGREGGSPQLVMLFS